MKDETEIALNVSFTIDTGPGFVRAVGHAEAIGSTATTEAEWEEMIRDAGKRALERAREIARERNGK